MWLDEKRVEGVRCFCTVHGDIDLVLGGIKGAGRKKWLILK
jgi:hypothetical protein